MRAYGWRARIGHIYPAVVAESFMYEFYRIVPPGVTLAQTNLVIQSFNVRWNTVFLSAVISLMIAMVSTVPPTLLALRLPIATAVRQLGD